jgi:hypothetical protein
MFFISSVGVETGYGLDGQDSIPGRSNKFISTLQRSGRLWVHSASYPMGTEGSLPLGVMRLGCEADHSPSSNTDVRNDGPTIRTSCDNVANHLRVPMMFYYCRLSSKYKRSKCKFVMIFEPVIRGIN